MFDLDKFSAKIELLIIQYNAVAKLIRTKKFKELPQEQFWNRREIWEDRLFELNTEIEALRHSSPVDTVPLWDGIFKK
ncbi:MAG: hypothetical protein EOO60_02575 [Hymenobacter sp.]|nr:MAG: hypothetical protein EOO60_02575 [Hymenobacter sp.]